MKKIYFTLIFSVFLASNNAYSSHLAGFDLTYRCLGGNDYEITLSFYRDCSGVTEPSAVLVSFTCSSNSSLNFSVTLPKVPGSGQEIMQTCPAMPTSCSGGNNYGMREWVYRANVTLPPCNYWRMSYSLCCRNPSNTIVGPTAQSAYIEAVLNNLQAPCASSPKFSSKPYNVICTGQSSCISYSAYSVNNDSLSYELVTPMTGASSSVTWLAGYSATQPIPSSPSLYLDPSSGMLCVTPLMSLVTPLLVRVNQWRMLNNVPVLIGSVLRDMQINVVNCAGNTPPALSGIDTTMNAGYAASDTSRNIQVCYGSPLNFTLWGHDPDTFSYTNLGGPEKFTISWNNGIPAASFTVVNDSSTQARALFSWTPTAGDISTSPKCFTATIRDLGCPFNAVRTYNYCIKVNGIITSLGSDTLLCKGESLQLTANNPLPNNSYTWWVNGSQVAASGSVNTYTFNSASYIAGVHYVMVKVSNSAYSCTGEDAMLVSVVNQPDVNLGNDTVLCSNGITLNAGPGNSYIWSTGQTSQTIAVTQPGGTFWVYVDGGINTRCNDSDTITVTIFPVSLPDIGSFTGPTVSPPLSEVWYSTTLKPSDPKTWQVFGGVILSNTHADSVLVRWFPVQNGKVILSCGTIPACTSKDTLQVIVGYAGINYLDNAGVRVYPMPAYDILTIEAEMNEKLMLEIFDIAGQSMGQSIIYSFPYYHNISGYSNGFYLFLLRKKDGSIYHFGKIQVLR